MSRKQRPGVGHIEFTGLRFFLQMMGGRVSRKVLVMLIRRFFTSRNLRVENLEVEFRMTQCPSGKGSNRSVTGCMLSESRVVVYLGAITSARSLMRTIAHELDHVAWGLQGREFDYSLPYESQPHEVRAYCTEGVWDWWVV